MAVFKLVIFICIISHSSAVAGLIGARMTSERLSADGCEECRLTLEIFADVISNTNVQDKLKYILEEVCHHLLGTMTQNFCQNQVNQTLPVVIQFLTDFIKTNQICTTLGVCRDQSPDFVQKVLTNHITKFQKRPEAENMTDLRMPSSLECTLCIYLFKSVENLIPRAEGIIIKVLAQVCVVLPARLREKCQGFVEIHVRQLLEYLMSLLTPKNVCFLLRLCVSQGHTSPECDSCQMLVILARIHLGPNATELQASAFLQSVCLMHPGTIPKCDSFTQRYGPILQKTLTKPAHALDQCRVRLCRSVRSTCGDKAHCLRGSPSQP